MLRFALALGGLVFLLGCALGSSRVRVAFEENAGVEKSLISSIRDYWEDRVKSGGKRFAEKAWRLEAPYIRELVSRRKYEFYLKKDRGLVRVDIRKFLGCEREFYCCFDLKKYFKTSGEKRITYAKDCWIKVKNNWYHVINNPLIFPELG